MLRVLHGLQKGSVLSALSRGPNITNFTRHVATVDPDTPAFNMENPYSKEKLVCLLCKHNITPDYKNVKLLSQFQSPYTGRVYGRHITGLCKGKQEEVEAEIVKAQSAGFMPYYFKETCFLKDPQLFDAEKPIRPHRF